MFDCLQLFRGQRPKAPQCCSKLRTPQFVHLVPKLPHDRNYRQPCDPIPELLNFLLDYLSRSGHIFSPLLQVGGGGSTEIVEIVKEHVVDVSDSSFDVARQRDVEDAERAVAARLNGIANASRGHDWNRRGRRTNEYVDVTQRLPAHIAARAPPHLQPPAPAPACRSKRERSSWRAGPPRSSQRHHACRSPSTL